MHFSRLMRLLFISLLIPIPVFAQQSNSTDTATSSNSNNLEAVSLLQKSLATLVGQIQVTDVTLAGAARRIAGSDDENGTVTLMATVAGDSKLSLSLSSGDRTEIRNHAGAPPAGSLPPSIPAAVISQTTQPVGAWSGPDGIIHGMSAHNVLTDATWFFPAATLHRLVTAPNYTLSFIGAETRAGQAVLHISVWQQLPQAVPSSAGAAAQLGSSEQPSRLLQRLSQMEVYLDPGTLLPVALAFNAHPDNNALVDIPTEIQFSNYQQVNGVQVPFHVQRYLNNSLILDLELNNATLNSGLASTDFQLQ